MQEAPSMNSSETNMFSLFVFPIRPEPYCIKLLVSRVCGQPVVPAALYVDGGDVEAEVRVL